MTGLMFAVLAAAFMASPPGSGGAIDAAPLTQPDAPVRIVACGALEQPPREGGNVLESASFEVVGRKTATAVRIGFAFFDALGVRTVNSVPMTGTFAPGVRADVKPFAGQTGASRKLVCFVMQAAFFDGTTWTLPMNGYPQAPGSGGPAPTTPAVPAAPASPPGGGAAIPISILAQPGGPVRIDRCALSGPRDRFVVSTIALTNVGNKPVLAIVVNYVAADSSGRATQFVQRIAGDYSAGAAIALQDRLPSRDATYTRATCAVGEVQFIDGTRWYPANPVRP